MNVPFEDFGNGKPLILLHAFPLSRKMWRRQVEDFSAAGFRVITPDQRGFGENVNFADINTMEDMASDIAQLFNSLKIEKAILMGLSMGGYVLFNFYRIFPDKVSALILCDTNSAADTDEKRESRFDLIENIETNGSEALINEMLPNLISPNTKQNNPELITEIEQMFREANPNSAIAALRGMAERRDHTEVLSNIQVPTLLIFGKNDQITNTEIAKKMHDSIPFSQMAIIREAGHYSNLEQPEQFNSAVLSFINNLDFKS